jgi:hypothetical protein
MITRQLLNIFRRKWLSFILRELLWDRSLRFFFSDFDAWLLRLFFLFLQYKSINIESIFLFRLIIKGFNVYIIENWSRVLLFYGRLCRLSRLLLGFNLTNFRDSLKCYLFSSFFGRRRHLELGYRRLHRGFLSSLRSLLFLWVRLGWYWIKSLLIFLVLRLGVTVKRFIVFFTWFLLFFDFIFHFKLKFLRNLHLLLQFPH